MRDKSIRAAHESERAKVVSTITAGFIADPVARWCFPELESFFTNMPGFINAYGGKAFDSGCAWVDESIFGAALWLPPGEGPDEEELGSYHPDEPHWFLPLIAVDPIRQGQGVGSELMKHAVARCDETETRAYLESSNPQNVSLYERHGFKIVGEVRSGDCPVFTAMLRDAR